MERLQERADQYGENLDIDVRFECVDAYIEGAKEQHAIDMEKACNWLKEYFKDGNFVQHYSVDSFIQQFCNIMDK